MDVLIPSMVVTGRREIASHKGGAAEPSHVLGYGKAFASFGEVVQGRLSDGNDFLVTMPIDLWSTCELICRPIQGPLVVECELEKSAAILYLILEELGIRRGFHLECNFTSNIPTGKGLSSSTADMLAALRAIQEVFGFILKETFVSRLFASVEPHDAVHYNSSVAYNHRKGVLLEDFSYVPNFAILAVDSGGSVDTRQYNSTVTFTLDHLSRFDELYTTLAAAYRKKDDLMIAKCATESARIHVERTGNPLLAQALAHLNAMGALGIIATHSGTCAGFLYPRDLSADQTLNMVDGLSRCFPGLQILATRSLQLLV